MSFVSRRGRLLKEAQPPCKKVATDFEGWELHKGSDRVGFAVPLGHSYHARTGPSAPSRRPKVVQPPRTHSLLHLHRRAWRPAGSCTGTAQKGLKQLGSSLRGSAPSSQIYSDNGRRRRTQLLVQMVPLADSHLSSASAGRKQCCQPIRRPGGEKDDLCVGRADFEAPPPSFMRSRVLTDS
jgi:hypothetical protein